MLEIIPNWHPLFVHFSIALLSMSTVFFMALKLPAFHSYNEQLKTLAYWNLWIGTGFAIVTAVAGWFAYNSVAHDTASHLAMTDHRNWALVTLAVYIVLTFWSCKRKNTSSASNLFTIAIIFASLLLMSTGWKGSEAVYRYGLGVMSLPKAEGDGHAHEHGAEPVKEKTDHHSESIGNPTDHQSISEHDKTTHTH